MLKGLGAGAAAAFLTLATPAAAQTAPAQTPAPQAQARQTIDRAQGEEMIKGMFAQVDANHDGVADAAEQAAVLEAVKGSGATEAALASIRRIFSEGAGPDGKVTLASFAKARMAAFDKADTNHDGKLDAAEQEAALARATPKP
jgi:Ca2+-binding EF-hand superfamily protein